MLRVLVDITEHRLDAYFTKFEQVGDVSPIISKVGITTGDLVLQVTMFYKSFLGPENTGNCRRPSIPLLVLWHHGMGCLSQPQPKSPTEAERTGKSGKVLHPLLSSPTDQEAAATIKTTAKIGDAVN